MTMKVQQFNDVSSAEIPVFRPLLGEREKAAAQEALDMGWLGMGSYVGEFENAIHEFIDAGSRKVVALSTGHAALHLGLIIAGVGEGDEVITPSFNNIADFQAIKAVGAEPVFCDINDSSLCIDLVKAEELVSSRTKAIIVMDYDLVLCDHDAVRDFADRHNLRVIHDAAHSFGSQYKGRPIGSFSDITMFSFDPVKTITCIDGGALVVQTEEEEHRLREMRLVGMGQPSKVMYQNKRAWTYDVTELGFRYHMANLHAAIGLAQISQIDEITSSRRSAAMAYSDAFAKVGQVRTPETDFDGISPFLYYIRVPSEHRDRLREHLASQHVDNGIHWQPGHVFSLFSDCRCGDLSVTEQVASEIISLPLHSMMNGEDQQRVIDAVKGFYLEG